ncbi:MAG: metalloregulator ArsR/SmtB family transcription factor [Thermodesulfobacteriota bacterium]
MDRDEMIPAKPLAAGRGGVDLGRLSVEELARGFCTLGNPIRLGILLAVGGSEFCVTQLVQRFDVTQGAVSQHLRRLRKDGLVVTRRAHKNVYYRLNEAAMRALLLDGLRQLAEPQACRAAGRSAARRDGGGGG